MRTRIATDLHDDIGANLTRIALLSEVAKPDNGRRRKAVEADGNRSHRSPVLPASRSAR